MTYAVPEIYNQSEDPKVANLDGNRMSTNQEAITVPIWCGIATLGLKWLGKAYRETRVEVKRKVGKKKTTVGNDVFVDVFGAIGISGDYVREIRVNNQPIWKGTLARTGAYNDLVVPDKGKFRFRWGYEGGGPDLVVPSMSNAENEHYIPAEGRPWIDPANPYLADVSIDLDFASPSKPHPSYRGELTVEIEGLYAGFNAGSVPSVEIVVERRPYIWADHADNVLTFEGANPVFHIAECIASNRWGVGAESILDESAWRAFGASVRGQKTVSIEGVGTFSAAMNYQSAMLTRSRTMASYMSEIAAYYDGFFFWEDGKLVPGAFPEAGDSAVGLPVLDIRNIVGKVEKTSDGTKKDNRISVVCRDRSRGLKDTATEDDVLAEIERSGKVRRVSLARPNYVTSYQGKALANREAVARSGDVHGVALSVFTSWYELHDLAPGKRFRLEYSPLGFSMVVRIVGDNFESGGNVVSLQLQQERGLWPERLAATNEARPVLAPRSPLPALNRRIFQLPKSFGVAVVPFVERPHGAIEGYSLWYSDDNASYDFIEEIGGFALRGSLLLGVGSGDGVLRINASGADLGKLEAQSGEGQIDDRLLLLVGDELCSVGSVTPLGGGSYDVGVLRGRMDTEVEAHNQNVEVFVLDKASMVVIEHADFPVDPVVRWFKVQTHTYHSILELSDDTATGLFFNDNREFPIAAPTLLETKGIGEGAFVSWVSNEDTRRSRSLVYLSTVNSLPAKDAVSYMVDADSISIQGLIEDQEYFVWVREQDYALEVSDLYAGPVTVTPLGFASGGAGKDGIGISFKGELPAAPENPELNWSYKNTTDGIAYIWDGDSWDVMVKDGQDGEDGAPGQTPLVISSDGGESVNDGETAVMAEVVLPAGEWNIQVVGHGGGGAGASITLTLFLERVGYGYLKSVADTGVSVSVEFVYGTTLTLATDTTFRFKISLSGGTSGSGGANGSILATQIL